MPLYLAGQGLHLTKQQVIRVLKGGSSAIPVLSTHLFIYPAFSEALLQAHGVLGAGEQ